MGREPFQDLDSGDSEGRASRISRIEVVDREKVALWADQFGGRLHVCGPLIQGYGAEQGMLKEPSKSARSSESEEISLLKAHCAFP